jgi:hypothetical protein
MSHLVTNENPSGGTPGLQPQSKNSQLEITASCENAQRKCVDRVHSDLQRIGGPQMNTQDERRALRQAFPDAFEQGVRDGFTLNFEYQREKGDYPKGFNAWEPRKRDAYFAAFNVGRIKRLTPSKTERAA